jgi:hypothetical protein
MISGDLSAEKMVPQPLVGLFRIPDRANTIEHNAVDRLAADYAQVYFPSQEFSSLTKNYETGYLDPWKRPSRYAPFIHYLCYISFCKLDYGYASFFHMLTQMVLFFAFFVAAFKILGVASDIWQGLLLTSIFLFVTPAGLSWFERGQFSLYVALSYLLLILGFIKNKPIFAIASAFFAYVKWTSFPFIFVIFAIFLLSSKDKKDGAKNLQLVLAYAVIILVLSLAFRSRFIHFFEGLYKQEANVDPVGISLALLFPKTLVKILPFFLIPPGYFYWRKYKTFEPLIPYLIGCGILLLMYPTVAFEYNIPNLFCFIPLIFYWTKDSQPLGLVIRYIFFLFIILASSPNYLTGFMSGNAILIGYLVVSAIFLLIPLFYTNANTFTTKASQ